MNLQEKCLADAAVGERWTREIIAQHGQLSDAIIETMLAPHRALRVAIETLYLPAIAEALGVSGE